MKPTFDHQLVGSFVEFLNYKVLTKGTAFDNRIVNFTPTSSRLTGYAVYSSPYRPFNADSSVTGSWVPSGISGVAGFIPRGTSGLSIDWENGRVIMSGAAAGLTNLSGGFAIKDFAIQYELMDEEQLLFSTRFFNRNAPVPATLTGLGENIRTIPSIFVKYTPGNNEPFALGGLEQSNSEFRCFIISDDRFLRDGAAGIIRDLARSNFGLMAVQDSPFGFFGDIKSGDQFNYTGVSYNKSGSDLIMVDNVHVSPINDKLIGELNPKIYVTIADVEVKPVRYTRL